MDKAKVLVGMPSGGFTTLKAVQGLYTSSKNYEVVPMAFSVSALAFCFNNLWAHALVGASKGEITHFAMLHSDVEPQAGWLDVLMQELDETKLGLISCVIPIKSMDGLTSTAVGPINDIWNQQRLTMKEVAALPETFTDKDLVQWKLKNKREGQVLLLNTGCWVCDLRIRQFHHVDEKGQLRFTFTQKDRIFVRENGQLIPQFAPEDWIFSRDCHKAGVKIGATRKVKLTHSGPHSYSNQGAWGNLEEDR
jgi:hypothetical protein